MRALIVRRSARALAACIACSPLAAAADAQVEPVRLVYQAYAGCPDEARFVREVSGHIEHARLAVGDEPARTFVVAVRPDGDQILGSLQITIPCTGDISFELSLCRNQLRAVVVPGRLDVELPRSGLQL